MTPDRQIQAGIDAALESLRDRETGAGSDLDRDVIADDLDASGYVELHGNVDLRQLVAAILDAAAKPTLDALAGLSSTIRPLGQDLTRDYVREVWDAFVKPTQADSAPPQSMETLALMSILRAVYVALPATESEPQQ